jgi:hypothetical protein
MTTADEKLERIGKRVEKGTIPSSKEGALRPITKRSLPLTGRSGGGQKVSLQVFDLPGRAETKAACHLFDRRGRPSFEEGIVPFSNVCPIIQLDSARLQLTNPTKEPVR